ncbi:MAG: carbohydrate porin [Verrucomicrobiales bacterium]|nr:carbohydrate porin [Verrucomicrobiales bacterium]
MKVYTTVVLSSLFFFTGTIGAGDFDTSISAKEVEFETPPSAITPYFTYAFDYFHNARGGIQNGGSAMGLFDVGAELNLADLFGWKGSTFVVSAFGGHGSDFSGNFTGDLGVVSNIYTDTNFNIFHLYLELSLGSGESFVRVGQFGIDDDFMSSETASLFLASPFGPFNTQSANMAGPIFPLSAPGAIYNLSPNGNWYLKTGIYAGDAGAGGPRDRGFEWNFGGPSGFTLFSEAGAGYGDGAGTLKFGGYWHSGEFYEYATDTAVDGLGAIYGIMDHCFIDGDGTTVSLDGFIRGSLSGGKDRVTATTQIDAGLVMSDLFAPSDALGVAVSHTTFGDDYLDATPGVTGAETIIEATYRIQVNDHFAIQPDLQYIVSPHFSGRNAAAVGIRGELSF